VTARAPVPTRSALMTRLLAIALVIVTALPILVFATDFTNSRVLRAARQAAAPRARARPVTETPDARRERIRVRRAGNHPTVPGVAMAIAFQLVMLTAIAVVGRRIFVLRL
jgi:hypothetical protein